MLNFFANCCTFSLTNRIVHCCSIQVSADRAIAAINKQHKIEIEAKEKELAADAKKHEKEIAAIARQHKKEGAAAAKTHGQEELEVSAHGCIFSFTII